MDDGEDEDGEERAFVADEEDSADGRTVDELFDERIGQANRTQLAQFALSSFAWFPAAFLTLTSVFTALRVRTGVRGGGYMLTRRNWITA